MGGDCLNFGCVPSKTMIRSSRIVGEIWRGQALGIRADRVEIDFGAVMARLRRIRAEISDHDSVARFTDLGVDVFLGDGQFSSRETISVGEQVLRFKKSSNCHRH